MSESGSGGGNIPHHKADVRSRVWAELRKVAYPDSRFDFDFSSFIADFQGSDKANDALLAHPSFPAAKGSSCVFITPDNCLEYLREKTLERGIQILTTTYGIRRGFWLLDPGVIEPRMYKYASTLDGMEKYGRALSLADIVDLNIQIRLMVTGTGAINDQGIRFGKGHGYFDLEWAVLSSLGIVNIKSTVTAAVVHDCQVLEGEELVPEEYDTVCDLVVTPTRVLEAGGKAHKPTCGILWDRLEGNMMVDIPPLRELRVRHEETREKSEQKA